MTRGYWLRLLPLALCVLFAARPAVAQSNFEQTQLGGRNTLMGGASVANGSDEATAFINPAGITRIPGQSFSFTTFAVNFGGRSVRGLLDPSATRGVQNPDGIELHLRVIPNTFCLFLDGPPKDRFSGRSRHKYSLCAAATERETFDFTDNSYQGNKNNFDGLSQATDMEFVRSTMAFSWGMEVGKKTNLGVTLRVDNARFRDNTSAFSYTGSAGLGHFQSASLARAAWSWDTSLVVGLTSKISRVVTLGAALTTPSQHLTGSYTSSSSFALDQSQVQGGFQDDGDFRYNHPGNLRLGLAFVWPRFNFEVNGSFYGPQKQRARANFDRIGVGFDTDRLTDQIAGRASVREAGRAVTNVSAGAEYFLRRNFSVLAGLGTDFSGLRQREQSSLGQVLFRQSKDALYLSAGMCSYGRRGRILLGMNGRYAVGRLLVADPTADVPSFKPLRQNQWMMSVVISGQINFLSVRDAAVQAAAPITRALESRDKEGEP